MAAITDLIDQHLDGADDAEQAALDLFLHLRDRFGWDAILTTRADADERLRFHLGDDTAALTDDQWAEVTVRLSDAGEGPSVAMSYELDYALEQATGGQVVA